MNHNEFMQTPPQSAPEQSEGPKESPVDRIGKEETEKRTPEILRLATRGIADLFELLPKSKDATVEDITRLIEYTELNMMLPGMREKFAKEMAKENLHSTKDKADFISRALETEAIKMFVHLEAMKAGSDATLERLREERKNGENSSAEKGQADRERDARLEELRREILNEGPRPSSGNRE